MCRYGGDEYIVFLKNIRNQEDLVSRMERFKECMRDKSKEKEQDVHCSIGAYQIKGADRLLDECVVKADELVYQAKKNGKDTYVIS